jgi:hypothetical protein
LALRAGLNTLLKIQTTLMKTAAKEVNYLQRTASPLRLQFTGKVILVQSDTQAS